MKVIFASLAILALLALILGTSWPQSSGQRARAALTAGDVPQSVSEVPQAQKSPHKEQPKVPVDANQSIVSSNVPQSVSQASQDQKTPIQQKPKLPVDANHGILSINGPQSVSPASQDQKSPTNQKPTPGGDIEQSTGDPDLPPGGGIDKETYLMLRNEYIAMLRGYLTDQPFDPMARGRAIEEAERQERKFAEAKATGLMPEINTDNWTPIGPSPIPNGQTFGRNDPVSGRTIAIAVHPTNPNIVYAGTAAGGVFRSLDGGASWTPIFDSAQSLAVDAIAIAPSQPSTIYVGTGEIIGFFGVGVYRIDNADSANPTVVGPINPVTDQGNGINVPAFQQTAVSEILVNPTDPATIFVSTAFGLGGIVSHNPSVPNSRALFGIYRSTNAINAAASVTFTKLTVNTSGGLSKGDTQITDMAMEPGNPNTIVCWVEGAAISGGGGVYRSANALAASPLFTQTLVSNTSNARGELAINRSNQVTTVLAATGETPVGSCPAGQNGRLRRSTDGGQTWPASLSGGDGFCDGQCFYDIAVDMNQSAASPIIHIGGSADYNAGDCSFINKRSVDGGSTFAKNETGLHPDVHVVAVAPSNQNIVYTGNDGGIWKSTDGGATWTSLNNSSYSATQFISLALHPTDREYMTGGTQDNGTEFKRANGTWTQIAFGDGGYTLIDRNATDTTNVTIYHTYYNKKNNQILFERVTTTADAEAKNWATRGAFLGFNGNCTSNNGINCSDSVLFYAPMALGPGNPNSVYFGTDRLYRSTNRGDTMSVVGSVGAISSGSPIASISISPQNDNVRIVGLQNGQVWATSTGGTFINVTPPNASSGIPVGKVFIDPTTAATAYVTYGGFGIPAGRHIFKTTNLSAGTPSWTDSSNGIPDVPVDAFSVDRLTPQNLYAGTDIGVYRSTDGGSSWVPFNGGLPRLPVFDIGFQEQGQTNPNSARVLRIATHGRGIWEIQVGSGGGCNYSLNPTSQSFGSSGGNSSFNVTAGTGCTWSAASNASWITTSSSGSGNGTVNYTVASNSSSARTGAITVGGQTFTISQSAGNGGCPSTTITVGQTVNGTLTTADCFFTGTTHYVDVYNFSGTTGQQIAITMNSSSFDTYLYLLDSANQLLAQDDDGGGGTNARIPAINGFYTLPATGLYTVYATSYAESSTGAYSVTLSTASGCAYTLNPTNQIFIASASTGSFTVSAAGNCSWTATSNVSWLSTNSTGTGNGTVSYSVAANTGDARTGTINVSGETFTVFQSAGNGNGCAVTTIVPGQTINATLTAGCVFTGTLRYVDPYNFNGTAGQQIVIAMTSTAFDTYLFLNSPDNRTITEDDDGGGGTNSRIPATAGFFTLPTTGLYTIFATSYSADGRTGDTGPYTISLNPTSCTYSVNPTSQSVGAAASNNSFGISAAAGCSWTAFSNASWITTISSGSGNGTVNYSVAANLGSARTGTISVGGQLFTVTQSDGTQNYSITLNASPPAGGTVSGSGTFAAGSSRTVTASANANYTFTNWTENGSVVSTSASYTFTLNANRNLVANFTAVTYTITVSASPSGNGTVSGGGTFAAGSSRTVTATANGGYTFANWTENGSVVSTLASYSFTLNNNRNLVANFNSGSVTNFALASNAGVATASSSYNSSYPASAVNNGDRRGLNWGNGGGWTDATPGVFPDWVQIDFNGVKTINEIDVFTVQDNYGNPVEPTDAMTFALYGITAFDVQYWDGATWVTVPGGSVAGNNKVKRTFTFAPVTTSKTRVMVNKAMNDGYSRIAEIEAYGNDGSTPTPTPTPTPTATPTPTPTPTAGPQANFALASNGGVATASSTYSSSYPASGVNNGDRKGLNWGNGGGWTDATAGVYPDWVQIDFNGTKTINEIDVFTIQDDYGNPIEPTGAMTFGSYGITAFDVQYWDGASWIIVPSGSVNGNNKVWRSFTFGDIQTNKVRVLVNNSLGGYSRITEVEAWGRLNVALASNGATATASSTYSSGYAASGVNNGDRKGLNWGNGGGWTDATPGVFPDWVQIDFNGAKTINEIDVFTVQDNYGNPVEPTDTMTFALYGITAFDVQYWDGANWVTVPGGSVTGNNKVKSTFTFAPVTTSKTRVMVNKAMSDGYSRIAEIEAYGNDGGPPPPTTTGINFALSLNGAVATASSSYSSSYPASAVNNGDRKGLNLGNGGTWNDATPGVYPDWVQIDFNGTKTLGEIDVFSIQDNYGNPVEPTDSMTFSQFGITAFDVQYWDGALWVTVPGGSVTGNNQVWRKFTFADIQTNKVRVLINNTLGAYSRMAEVEAWSPRPNVALASNGAVATASSTYNSSYPASAVNNGDRKGLNLGNGGTWNDATPAVYPDWVQIDFNGSKTIGEIDVFTIQDNYSSPVEPTDAMTFSSYGITAFDVQYWNGGTWVTVPGGSVTGNNKVKSKFTFSPITTSKIRVLVNNALASYSRIIEIESYEN